MHPGLSFPPESYIVWSQNLGKYTPKELKHAQLGENKTFACLNLLVAAVYNGPSCSSSYSVSHRYFFFLSWEFALCYNHFFHHIWIILSQDVVGPLLWNPSCHLFILSLLAFKVSMVSRLSLWRLHTCVSEKHTSPLLSLIHHSHTDLSAPSIHLLWAAFLPLKSPLFLLSH